MGLNNYKLPEKYTISAKIKEIGENFAVLLSECEIEFKWPRLKLPPNSKIGDDIKIKIITEETLQEEYEVKMREILNEIVN